MTKRNKRWLAAIGLLGVAGIATLGVAAYVLGQRLDPYIREQAILYLEKGFDSEVELSALRLRVPRLSPLRLLFGRGRGTMARVEGEGLAMRYK